MAKIPTLETNRLKIRPFVPEDAPYVKELAGIWEIAKMTTNMPHPYEERMAEAWISTHLENFDQGKGVTFAITLTSTDQLVGAIGLKIEETNCLAEMGYWIGKPFWNHGYATEATSEVLRYAFEVLNLNRVQARHMTKNSASGRVMQKVGMQYKGTLRQSIYRWDKFEDAAIYSVLRNDFCSSD